MPSRQVPLITQEIYHVLNRGVARAPIFTDKRSYSRSLQSLDYYRFIESPVKLSHFLVMSMQDRQLLMDTLEKENKKYVEIYCYCLMPNHFHLLLRQLVDNGLSKFIGKAINSYSKYFNIRGDRDGPLLQGRFKAVRIETDEQFIHVSRYIHINPYVGKIIERNQLLDYLYSSLPQYISEKNQYIIDQSLLRSYFRKAKDYRQFILDEADYKRLKRDFEHIMLE